MFEKSRRKIVAAIMSVLLLLFLGTLGVIYNSSYHEVLERNFGMLEHYAQLYFLERQPGEMELPGENNPAANEPPLGDTPAFQLSTFYSVAVSGGGNILAIDNPAGVYENALLAETAAEIIKHQRTQGISGRLIYLVKEKGGYMLVAFMDNTIIGESMSTLFRYTLAFGSVTIVLLFFAAVYLAKRIVLPMEEAYEKQKQFISDAGHELKTPISVISANAELLQREIGENPWLSNIQYENERMGVLVTQLLELARTENVTLQMETVDFSRLVGGESLPFESIVFEENLMLDCKIEDYLYVKGSSAQLKQLTAILLDNAIRHCQAEGKIILILKAERNGAVLSVINDGEEIPSDKQKQIFERFYRGDFARTDSGGHYGLGLAIAKAIVTAHKGKIEVLCQDGKVEFTVRLPLKK